MESQLLSNGLQGVLRQDDFNRSISSNQKQTCGRVTPGQVRNQVDGGFVAPVKILQQKNQRNLSRQRLNALGHFAQHSLSRGAKNLTLQSGLTQRRRERRHLG